MTTFTPQTVRAAPKPLMMFAPPSLQRPKCACGATLGPTSECETCRRKRVQQAPNRSDVHHTSSSMTPHTGHEFGRMRVGGNSVADRNSIPFAQASSPAKSQASGSKSANSSLQLDGDLNIAAGEEEEISIDAPIGPRNPFAPRPAPAPQCPTEIRVAEILHADLAAGNVASGFHTGWGGVARMEVSDSSGRNWDGTRIHENLMSGPNTCEPGTSACPNSEGQGGTSGTTFTVGDGVTSSRLGFSLPPVQNCFYDMHIMGMRVNLLQQQHLRRCEQSCFQWYECSGRQFGHMFVIDRTLTPDQINVGGNAQDVTRVRLNVTELPGPPAPQGPGDFPRRTRPVGEGVA